MAPIKVGIAGYGNASRVFHLPFISNLKDDFEIVAIFQRSQPTEGKRHVTTDYPDLKWYSDLDEFLADKDVELVIVTTPHRENAHYLVAKAAILANKHVVVEKPFVNRSIDAEELIQLNSKTDKILFPFQNRRYDSDFLTLKKYIDSGALGTITDIQLHYDIDLPQWVVNSIKRSGTVFAPGTGMNFGIGCHTIDQALCLFGPPATVRAHYRVMSDPHSKSETEDTFDIYLTYPPEKQGLVVEVKTAVISRLNAQLKHFARGRDGSYVKFGEDPQENQINAGVKVTDPSYGVEPKEDEATLVTSKQVEPTQVQRGQLWEGKVPTIKGDYTGYYRDVAKAIRGEIKPYVTAKTARDNIRIIELARESWKQQRTLNFD